MKIADAIHSYLSNVAMAILIKLAVTAAMEEFTAVVAGDLLPVIIILARVLENTDFEFCVV